MKAPFRKTRKESECATGVRLIKPPTINGSQTTFNEFQLSHEVPTIDLCLCPTSPIVLFGINQLRTAGLD